MGEDGRDRVVDEVADALTLDQDVDWDRCAREAEPASRRTLENLRLVAGLLADFRAPGDTAADSGLPGGVAVRFAVRALIVFAALWAAASLMVGLWGWDEFRREHPELTLYLALVVAGSAATGCLFLFAGRRDRRTWLLGGYFLVVSAFVNPFALLGFLRGAPPVEPFGYPDFAFPYFYPFMFAPPFLWAFARECPRVHPQDEASYFHVLLDDDRRWVVDSGADAIVPVPGPGRSCWASWWRAGGWTGGSRGRWTSRFSRRWGRRRGWPSCGCSRRPWRRPGRWRRRRPRSAPRADALGGRRAGGVRLQGGICRDGGAEAAGGQVPPDAAPGPGGMGAAYLARDLRLERDVASKTLTGESVFRLMGSKPEAWAMATVTHRAVAQIHGIESWRGRPFLVVELLPRGTLADRLRRGPVPASRALDIAALLADALAAVHEAGYLHGDVKPGNVGFASDGSAKLLDFGLAREANDATGLGGTLRYLSPEVLSGRPADEGDDVWSLCVMRYEMVSGEHPFAGDGADEVRDRIRRQRLARGAPAAGSDPSAAALAFAASVLTARRPARPATAHAFADRLRRVRGEHLELVDP